jgi:translocation and assembly module TamB
MSSIAPAPDARPEAPPPGDKSALSPAGPTRGFRLGVLGWTALAAVGVIGAAWLARAPLAGFAIGQVLLARGVAHDFTVASVDLTGVRLRDVRLGASDAPDLTAAAVDAQFSLAPTPILTAVRIEGLQVKGVLTDQGLRFGALDAFLVPAGPPAPFAPPDLDITVLDADVTIATPLGLVQARGAGAGHLQKNFKAEGVLSLPQAATGAVALTVTAAGARADVTVNAARLSGAGGQVDALTGAAAITLPAGAIAAVLEAQAQAETVAFAPLSGRDLTLRLVGPLGHRTRLTWDARAGAIATPVLVAASGAQASGDLRLEPNGIAADARLRIGHGLRLTPAARANLASLSAPQDTPLGPLLQESRGAILAAMDSLQRLEADLGYTSADGGAIQLANGAITAATGARLTLRPDPARSFRLQGPAWRPVGAMSADISGGGVPKLSAAIESDGAVLKGRFALEAAARDSRAAVLIESAQFDFDAHRYTLEGEATLTGPLAGGRIEALRAPLRLAGRLGEGFSLAPQQGCLTMTALRLTAAGGVFDRPALRLCPYGADFLRVAPGGAISGGVRVPGVRLTGRLSDTGKPTTLAFGGAQIDFRGQAVLARMDNLEFSAALEAGELTARADALEARFDATGFQGGLRAGRVDGPALPIAITDASLQFASMGDRLALSGGRAQVSDRRPADIAEADWRPRFNTLRLDGVRGQLDEGLLTTTGEVILPGRVLAGGAGFAPDRRLGGFSAEHRVASNVGSAKVFTQGLIFDQDLDAYDISDPIRGVASGVKGKLDGTLSVAWTGGVLSAEGEITLDSMSFQTAALGQVDGVSGTLRFEDLLKVRTGPGQSFKVGRIDPGVGVIDGALQFQILSATEVRLEMARWPFAGGALYINSQLLDLSSRRFELTVQLTEIDLSSLVETLGLPDIAATGKAAGTFPLKFSEDGVEVVNGELISLGPGTLAYSGPVGDTLQGPPQVAFDALQSFQFDALRIELDGPLASDVIARVRFEGVNLAPLRDMSALAPLPGIDLGQPVGLPFKYDISVALPFRQLLGSYQGLVDGRTYVRRYLSGDDFSAPRRPTR